MKKVLSFLAALIVLVLGALPLAMPQVALAETGTNHDGLWTSIPVDVYTSPSGSGTVTGKPNGCAEGSAGPVVAGGKWYATGTWPAVFSGMYAIAPLNFTLTAVPAEGYKFVGWNGVPLTWISGATVHIQYDEAFCDLVGGWYQPTAMFTLDTVDIDLRPAVGLAYSVPSGIQSFSPFGIAILTVQILPAYSTLYEFGGWIFSQGMEGRIDDESSMSTYIDMSVAFDFPGTYWVQPSLKLKSAVTDYELSWSVTSPSNGSLGHAWTDNLTVGEKVAQNYNADNVTWAFRRWDLTNVGCSDIYSDSALFWLLTAANGSVEAVNADTSATADVVTLTLAKVGTGTTDPAVGAHTVLTNQTNTIKAIPGTGWTFLEWQGLPDSRISYQATESVLITENTTVTAIFQLIGDDGTVLDPDGGAAAAGGVWGKMKSSLGSVGLDNAMGRAFFILALMVVVTIAARKNKAMRVILPCAVLGVGIIGNWIPMWVVVLLAVGLALGLLQFLSKKGATGDAQ